MDVCPHCGSSEFGRPAAGAVHRCARCGESIGAATSEGAVCAAPPPEFDDLDEVLRETAAPLSDIDTILSEVHVPRTAASSSRPGAFFGRLVLAAAGLTVAGLLVFGLGKIAEFADQPPANVAAAGGAAEAVQKRTEPAEPPEALAPLNKTWTTETDWLAELGQPVSCGEYELRLPKDYTRVESASAEGKTTCRFRSGNRPDDDLNVVTVFIDDALSDRGGVPEKLDPDWELDFMLDGYRSTLAEFVESERDQGSLAGREFVRGRFAGKEAGENVCGVLLASYLERRMIVVSFVCSGPPGGKEYKRLENSLLTLRPTRSPQ